MEMERLEVVFLELKYCERCGGLWFRRTGESEVYCQLCALQWSEVAGSDNEAGLSYARLRRSLADDRRMVDFLLICPQEGNA